jgi:stage II sporulation protein D
LRGRAFAIDPAPSSVRVRLFAADQLVRADISGVHLGASSPPTEVTGQYGPLFVTAFLADGTSVARHYDGTIRSASADGHLTLINEVGLESYVASVLASEISSRWHSETLRAQAIAVRTYAVRRMQHKHPASFDVVDTTSNQVYRGIDGVVASLTAAALATAGQIAKFGSGPADVWYHSACGGHTAASVEVTGVDAPPYLRGAIDSDAVGHAYCAQSPYYTWRNTLSASAIARVAGIDHSSVTSISVTERWGDGRARSVVVGSADGANVAMDGRDFYVRAGSVLGYKVVPSAFFDIAAATGTSYEISGHGVGHGVGMCQWGAQGRALAGQSAAQILAAYFPGTTLAPVTLSTTPP